MSDLSLLEVPLWSLHKMGLLSTKRVPKIVVFITTMLVISEIYDMIIMFLQCFYIKNHNIQHYMDNFQGLTIVMQCLSKWFAFIYYKDQFINLISYTTDKFWSAMECSKSVQKNIKKLSLGVRLTQRLLMCAFVLNITFGFTVAIIARKPALGYWTMENQTTLLNIFKISIWTDSYIMIHSVACYDSLYIGFCYAAIIQCRILCNHLELLSVKNINSEHDLKNYCKRMKRCIEHHALLLNFHEELQNIYSVPVLIQLLTATPCICAVLFTMLAETSSIVIKVMCVVYFSSLVIQLSMYSVTSDCVTDELLLISEAVYNSDWHSQYFPVVKIPIILLMQRAQQKVTFKSCGLVDINIDTLVKFYKFCFSTCLALKSFEEMKNT